VILKAVRSDLWRLDAAVERRFMAPGATAEVAADRLRLYPLASRLRFWTIAVILTCSSIR
jgi:hypothetical protein